MEVIEPRPALNATKLVGVVAKWRETLAAAWQIPDRLIATIGHHRLALWAGGTTNTPAGELAALGATDTVVKGIAPIRTVRIGSRIRNPSRGGLFRGIRKIRSQGS